MTRAERLAHQETQAKAKVVEQRRRLAQAKRERRAEEIRQRRKRQYLVGQLADAAGLLTLRDADLAALFAALAPLLHAPQPGAVLASLLCETEWPALVSGESMAVPGCANLLRRSCGPCGASVDTVQ